jgi:transcriptional regulator with XRE-family HTH domain
MEPVRWLRTLAGVSQEELARRGSTSQPTVAAYEAGRKSPTLRTVERLAAGCGLEAFVDFVPPLTREDRRSIHLHQAIAARLLEDPAAVISRALRNLRRMRTVQPDAAPLLDEWRRILRRPVDDVAAAMTDPRPWARELRQVTPFAGVLSARERAVTYRRFQRQEPA